MIRIGVSANWNLETKRLNIPKDYMDALLRAGCLPLLLPQTEDDKVLRAMVDLVDGLLFPGGEDLHPECYGESPAPYCGEVVPERDRMELKLYQLIKQSGKPFLAICRGMQLVNVAEGGTLWQDLAQQKPTETDHAQFARGDALIHEVDVVEGSLLTRLTGSLSLAVNSRHHQAIKSLGQGLQVSATSRDGIIEAVEFTDGRPGLCLQWHPENLSRQDGRMQALFNWLVRVSGERR